MSTPENRPPAALRFPFPEKPMPGTVTEVAPGVLWLRLALPYALDHINLYLFEDGEGWALFDAGIADARSIEAWEQVLAQVLGGRPITQMVISHFHPDHVGLAGWLHQRFGMPLHMSQAEFLTSRLLQFEHSGEDAWQADFYRNAGLTDEQVAQVMTRGLRYLKSTTGLPPVYKRLIAGEELVLGGRRWQILTGGGHSHEQVMLWCPADGLFLAADQVLARISPNVSVFPVQPDADPLGLYLTSLAALRRQIPADAFVLPSHNLPFYGLHDRLDELATHHEHRCDLIADACRPAPRTCEDIVPVLFRRALDAHQLSFAVGEALAHLNRMVYAGRLSASPNAAGILEYRSL